MRAKHEQDMLRILKPGGRLLLYNWAYEQSGRRKGCNRSQTNVSVHGIGAVWLEHYGLSQHAH
jgi:hypothetical protein